MPSERGGVASGERRGLLSGAVPHAGPPAW